MNRRTIFSILFAISLFMICSASKADDAMYQGENNGVSVKFNKGSSSPGFVIANRSKSPIDLNTSEDNYFYQVQDGTLYLIEIRKEEPRVLDPGGSAEVHLDAGAPAYNILMNKLHKGEIKEMMALIDHRKNRIMLAPEYTQTATKSFSFLEGIIVDAKKGNSALINGRIVHGGESVGGIKVEKVNADSVIIAVGGQKKTLKVGEKL